MTGAEWIYSQQLSGHFAIPMHIADPDYINTVFAFPYRGVTIQITSDTHLGTTIYTAWIDYATGSAVAVPKAYSRSEAVRRAKGWVARKFKFDLAADD